MENFNQLLNQYVQRAGISDAELARTLGISRQTIFRWREGMTARPRHREDVVALSRKLRLTPEEQDRLLLAAGFRPQSDSGAEAPEVIGQIEAGTEKPRTSLDAPLLSMPRRRWWSASIVALVLILFGGLTWWATQGQNTVTSSGPNRMMLPANSASQSVVAPAAPDETLVLVTHFANYAGSQVGYNVAGRLAQALQQEVDRTADIRIAVWPEVVNTRADALQVGQALSATLVIYGEYDVGRVMVAFAHPADRNAFTDPALQQHVADVPDLSATINTGLPRQVRSLALLALGQIYVGHDQADQALLLLVRARDNLQNTPTLDDTTWGLVNFYLGLAYQSSRPADLDAAVEAYTEAIEVWPDMLSSRLNRSAAYANRGQPGDLELALADITAIIKTKPDWPLAYSNRASILINLGGADNFARAQADLKKALALDPALPGAFVQRAFLAFMQDKPMAKMAPDLEHALALRPDDFSALNLLCWGYIIEQMPERALPYCQQAIELNPEPVLIDSRGLAYAQMGDYQAALADVEVYVAWLENQTDEAWQPVLARRRAWLAALKLGENPLTPEVLAEIRHEFGK